MAKPKGGRKSAAGRALSDDFTQDRFGTQWCFHDPKPDEMQRVERTSSGLRVVASGTSPADSAPLVCAVGDRSYEAEISLGLEGGAEGGLLLFYNHKAFVGVAFDGKEMKTFQYAEEQTWSRSKVPAADVRIRLTNRENVITYHYSVDDGATWQRNGTRMEVSGMNHNVFGGFLSLKVGIYSAGTGQILLKDFLYKAIA